MVRLLDYIVYYPTSLYVASCPVFPLLQADIGDSNIRLLLLTVLKCSDFEFFYFSILILVILGFSQLFFNDIHGYL